MFSCLKRFLLINATSLPVWHSLLDSMNPPNRKTLPFEQKRDRELLDLQPHSLLRHRFPSNGHRKTNLANSGPPPKPKQMIQDLTWSIVRGNYVGSLSSQMGSMNSYLMISPSTGLVARSLLPAHGPVRAKKQPEIFEGQRFPPQPTREAPPKPERDPKPKQTIVQKPLDPDKYRVRICNSSFFSAKGTTSS